ncbi:MAG: diversity-generating retroelement protein bAvd family protein [Opitutus sp.]|nr:diversity-generating retroelement protein bAvd family protein [Opitutus sp.]
MKDYREIKAWQKGHELTLAIYAATQRFPREELFGLTSQMRRAASSVPANIAEGCGRDGDAELKRFLNIALGSACELDYFIQLATDLKHLDRLTAEKLSTDALELRRMRGAFIRKLKA